MLATQTAATSARDYIEIGRLIYNSLRSPRRAVPRIIASIKDQNNLDWNVYAKTTLLRPVEGEAQLAFLIGMIRAALHKNHKKIAREIYFELAKRAVEFGYEWERI